MKNFILFIALSFSFLISNSQNEEADFQKSYILTTNGEKIAIFPNEQIEVGRKDISYCLSKTFDKIKYYKKDVEKKIPVKTYKSKHKRLKIKNIEKIIDQDKLYLPIESKKLKSGIALYRLVVKNEKYTLGYFYELYSAGNQYASSHKFIIINNNTNEIEEIGNLYAGRETHETTIKNYFSNCFNEETFFYKVNIEPYVKFLNGRKSTEKTVKEWYKFMILPSGIGYLAPFKTVFLPKFNQFVCD